MVERVAKFFEQYPNSRFLKDLIEPVREVKAKKIHEYFANNQKYAALSYFEQTRDTLFRSISHDLKVKLFNAYIDTYKPQKANEFSEITNSLPESDLNNLRIITFYSEMADLTQKKNWTNKTVDLAKKLRKRNWQSSPNTLLQSYLNRLLAVGNSQHHLRWMLNLANAWAKHDPIYHCSIEYPVLYRLHINRQHASLTNARLKEIMQQLFPNLLHNDEECAISYLQLELAAFESSPATLATIYLKRQNWKITKPLTSLFWQVAELNYNRGHTSNANALWKIIRDKAPADAPEIKFAKVRLDPTKTEFEGLWQ